MKTLIIVLFLSISALATQTFHYHDRVVVTTGFYQGCSGNVEHDVWDGEYGVGLDTDNNGNRMTYYDLFNAKDLKLVSSKQRHAK